MQKMYSVSESLKKALVSVFLVLTFEILLLSQNYLYDIFNHYNILQGMLPSLVISLIVLILTYLIIFWFIRTFLLKITPIKKRIKDPSSLRFWIFVTAVFFSSLFYIFFMVFDTIPVSEAEEFFMELIQNHLWYGIVSALIIAPIFEELFFRRYILTYLLTAMHPKMAIIISSVLFGLFHMNLRQFIFASVLGLALGHIYNETKDIKYSMLLHLEFNLISFLPFFNNPFILYSLFGISFVMLFIKREKDRKLLKK